MIAYANEVWMPKDTEIRPFFQPIVSMETRKIVGYESLGRYVSEDGQPRSLGPFFANPAISDSEHIRVDRILRDMALRKLSLFTEPDGPMLFLNLKPSWIYNQYHTTGELQTLQLIEKYNINPSRVVIEVTEEEFKGNPHELRDIIELYRAEGCTIAIDDIGSGFSNFDRIALIQPKILKVDLNIMKKSSTHMGYQAVMRSFSILAAQLGASLLVEGVETKEDLQHALQVGARYVQGYLFSQAVPEFVVETSFSHVVKEQIRLYSEHAFDKYTKLFAIEKTIVQWLEESELALTSSIEANVVIANLLPGIADHCLRVYVCQEDGKQVSANFTRNSEGDWSQDDQFVGANWIWRPYFVSNIVLMKTQGRGILSEVYTDLETSHLIQTYSCSVGEGMYMFIDILTT